MTHLISRTAAGVALSAAVLAPLAACSSSDNSDSAASSATGSPSATPPSSIGTSGGTKYADDSYTVRGVYGGAPSYMTVTLKLDDDTVTDVDVQPMPGNNDTSRGYQERFAAAVPDEVVGKSLDDADVGVLAGASGCADGFNDALAKIREQAAS